MHRRESDRQYKGVQHTYRWTNDMSCPVLSTEHLFQRGDGNALHSISHSLVGCSFQSQFPHNASVDRIVRILDRIDFNH